jgi:hypothetical protein
LPLPELPVRRWGPRNKQAVIEALGRGEITFGQAYRRYDLSPEELDQWLWAYRHRGFVGLFIGKRGSVVTLDPDSAIWLMVALMVFLLGLGLGSRPR